MISSNFNNVIFEGDLDLYSNKIMNSEIESFLPPNGEELSYNRAYGDILLYAEESLRTIYSAVDLIKSKEIDDTDLFIETLKFLASERQALAKKQGTFDAESFGLIPKFSYFRNSTPLLQRYTFYANKILNNFANELRCSEIKSGNSLLFVNKPNYKIELCLNYANDSEFEAGAIRIEETIVTYYTMSTCLDRLAQIFNEKIDQKIHLKLHAQKINDNWLPLCIVSIINGKIGILQASTNENAVILGYAKSLFLQALKWEKSQDNKELITLIAKLHKILAVSGLFARGTSAISENLTKVIFKYHGFKLVPYENNIKPDLEAYIDDEESYVLRYLDFFASSPFVSMQP
jgi:hypothetical protein